MPFEQGQGDVGKPQKAPNVGVFEKQTEESNMKLITRFELATLNETELHGLYRKIFNLLVQSEPHSAQRRNCLASLENIQNELGARLLTPQ